MQKVVLKLINSEHPIFIGQDMLSSKILKDFISGSKVLIVSHKVIADKYSIKLDLSLETFQKFYLFIEEGEKNKSLTNWEKIITFLNNKNFDKNDTVIGFGGGLIGDLAGFAAATYMRGINYIQIPTSLLAQANAAIGGKTAINYGSLKNLIGTMWYPSCILIDTSTLSTLKVRDYIAGIPEIAIQALIRDKIFFKYLEKNVESLKSRKFDILTESITRSCVIKAAVVTRAEKYPHVRNILNYGHTLAHAVEALYSCKTVLHGEAVSYGISFAAFLSYKQGFLNKSVYLRITAFIASLNIKQLKIETQDISKLVALMYKDKKTVLSNVNFILLKDIGETTTFAINDPLYLENILSEFISYHC